MPACRVCMYRWFYPPTHSILMYCLANPQEFTASWLRPNICARCECIKLAHHSKPHSNQLKAQLLVDTKDSKLTSSLPSGGRSPRENLADSGRGLYKRSIDADDPEYCTFFKKLPPAQVTLITASSRPRLSRCAAISQSKARLHSWTTNQCN